MTLANPTPEELASPLCDVVSEWIDGLPYDVAKLVRGAHARSLLAALVRLQSSPPAEIRKAALEEAREIFERTAVRIEHWNGSEKGPTFHWCTHCQFGRCEDENDKHGHAPHCASVALDAAIRALSALPTGAQE